MDFRDLNEFLKDTFKYILVIIAVFIVFIYIVSIQQVVGPSMNNTLSEGNVVVISKLSYKLHSINRGDIIVFEYNGMKNLIKRVIGLPGEKIEYKDNKLYINGVYYTESYLSNVTTKDFSTTSLGYDVIPDDYYLVLGDNRNNSMDSREIGLVSKKDIIGKVVMNIWPINDIKVFKVGV